MTGGRRKRSSDASAGRLRRLFEPYVWEWFERTFGRPSPPQESAWPAIARGGHTLVLSPTGSGKTLAAFLWCINDLFRMGAAGRLEDAIHVLYISPLKALNNDIQKNLTEPLAGIRETAESAGIDVPEVRSRVRTGDTPQEVRAAMVRMPPHILITTPESLFIILSTPKFREAFRSVRYVIVDEIHALCDNKRGVHLSLSLERLQHLAGHEFVRIGCSATQRPLEEIARFLVGLGPDGKARPCEIIDAGVRKGLDVQVLSPVDDLLEAHFDAIWGSAYDRMLSMIRDHDTTLVFTNSRYKTERTALRLNELSAGEPVAVGAHHGSMSKTVRLDMENRLKEGSLDALVATSSLELGIDVGSIDLVCQVESPKSVSRGMQRVGRAGHLLEASSKGRLLVTDRDDLVESAVLVRAMVDGEVDVTRIPTDCLDVLAQHVVGAVAADEWNADDLFALCRRAHCYRDLSREQYDHVLDMLAGNYEFETERAPFPKITWDKVNGTLVPERAARNIAYTAGGTIPDTADYDVYFEDRKTVVGRLDEGFVEDLRAGDIFVLGSSSWRVLGIRRNRVYVADVYGRAPTIPFWGGERDSRTYDLGALVGRFRREMETRMAEEDPVGWLQREYYVDENGARAICRYFREQQAVTGRIPSDRLVVLERFQDELGQRRIVVHSCFGIRVNETWSMALVHALQARGVRCPAVTVDDGVMLSLPAGRKGDAVWQAPLTLLQAVTPENVSDLVAVALDGTPVFASRFRHNAVRALLILRSYQGRKTPVWLQALRASALLEACKHMADFPVIAETRRECLNEALDLPALRQVLSAIDSGAIAAEEVETRVPSPFTHSLLLLGQYGDAGAIPARERRTRLIHLHRDLLRQILDEETLRNLLDPEAVTSVDARLQRLAPQRKARDANELARVLSELGDLVDGGDDDLSLQARVDGDARAMVDELLDAGRAIPVLIATAETDPVRWIATGSFPLYRDAFAAPHEPDRADRRLLEHLARHGPCGASDLPGDDAEERLERLAAAYLVLRLPGARESLYAATETCVPAGIREESRTREEARLGLIRQFMRRRGPVTRYEVMERYGFSDRFVDRALGQLHEHRLVARGEYVPTKSFPQWCWKSNLEEIHRLTLNRMRREMEPASPEDYCDFLLRWQHVHPEARLEGTDGLREVVGQLQGLEVYSSLIEGEILPSRVKDYRPSMLDRLCYGGEVVWRRFAWDRMSRGRIGLGFRRDMSWLARDPTGFPSYLGRWDDDVREACDSVRAYLVAHDACFFDDILEQTGLDPLQALRAVWHLVWTCEATTDSYESIRHAGFSTGLSACYDLMTTPGRKPVDNEAIARRMLDNRRLDPRLGRWQGTELLGSDASGGAHVEAAAAGWASLLLRRYGVVCRDMRRQETNAPAWQHLRRALARMELLGTARRGFFVDGLSGEQYALPEAVDALRAAKLRRSGADADDEPMVVVGWRDPANVFRKMLPIVDEGGVQARVRGEGNYVVFRAGQPVAVCSGNVDLLADLSHDRAARVVQALASVTQRPSGCRTLEKLAIRSWNGHPIDVSPARHLLESVGFVDSGVRSTGYVFDPARVPPELRAAEPRDFPAVLERVGKEDAPVEYDEEWIASRSHDVIRPKVRELLGLLHGELGNDYEFACGPREVHILYRGVRCAHPRVQQKQIRLHIAGGGWWPGLLIRPDTDLGAAGLRREILSRFGAARDEIDSKLDADS
jgi:ATP-dependent Lhr-like helicase